jgi:hypothetical protein
MATTLKTKIGHLPCLCCGERVPVKQADNGTINLSCSDCDFTGYVKAGTHAHRVILGKISRLPETAQPSPAQKPADKPAAPAPAATMAAAPVSKRNTIFG